MHMPSISSQKIKQKVLFLKVWNVHFSFNIMTQTVSNIYFPSNASVHSSIEHRPLVFLCVCVWLALTLAADSTVFFFCFQPLFLCQTRLPNAHRWMLREWTSLFKGNDWIQAVAICQRRGMLSSPHKCI